MLSGSFLNALGEAKIRAIEDAREDRLYRDPYAIRFIEEAERRFFNGPRSSAFEQAWSVVCETARSSHPLRTMGVRLVDDVIGATTQEHRYQVVMLGAGLDTHAFRFDLPPPVRLFELDHPELLDFKEQVLAAAGAKAGVERSVIPISSVDSWPQTLLDSGFRPDEPTLWVDHVYKLGPRAAARPGVRMLTELSAPGSRYGFPVPDTSTLYREVGPGGGAADATGLGPGARDWIEELGWSTTFYRFDILFASYLRGIELPDALESAGNVVAIRR